MAFDPNDPSNRSATELLRSTLREWGIEGLFQDAYNLVVSGLDSAAVLLELRKTPTYKQRFAANDERRAKGLAVLSEAEYVATETQYRNVLRMYGLPGGFYDSNDDLKNFLSNDLSPQELAERADIAQKLWLSKDEATRNVAKQFYGFTDGTGIAALLDPERAMPIVQRQYQAAQIGAIAQQNQLSVERARAEQLADLGITQAAAVEGFSKIGQRAPAEQAIAGRFGESITQQEQEDAEFFGTASARRKQQRLAASEAGLFQGRAAGSDAALNRSSQGQY